LAASSVARNTASEPLPMARRHASVASWSAYIACAEIRSCSCMRHARQSSTSLLPPGASRPVLAKVQLDGAAPQRSG
jgi:hypothetical protein